MSGEEMLRLYVALAVWGLMLVGAVKVLGLRRVLWAIGLIVVLAAVVAIRTLRAVTGSRRY